MSWANIDAGEKPNDAFPVFLRDPVLGQKWNPDGVDIWVIATDTKLSVGGVEYSCDVYAFGIGDKKSAIIWFSPGYGVIQQVDNIKKHTVYVLNNGQLIRDE